MNPLFFVNWHYVNELFTLAMWVLVFLLVMYVALKTSPHHAHHVVQHVPIGGFGH